VAAQRHAVGVHTLPTTRPRRLDPPWRRARTAGKPSPSGETTDVYALAAGWCSALDAAQGSIRAAGLYLGSDELRLHDRRIEHDRAAAVSLLGKLARESGRGSHLVAWLEAKRHDRAALGLPQTIEACVFDLDGVLTTSATLHVEAWADTLDTFLLSRARGRRRFVPFDRRREYGEYFAGRPRDEGLRRFLAARGLAAGPGLVGELAAAKGWAVDRRLRREGVAAFDASRSYLEAARLVGLGRAVVSASVNTESMLRHADLSALVDACVDGISMRVAGLAAKPAPDVLLAACRKLEVAPERTAAFETTAVGVAAARAAGIGLVVAVEGSAIRAGLGPPGPDVVVTDLSQLFHVS